MVWSALQDARESKQSLAVLWLDLTNAYGSVPHKLIAFALRRYRVPEVWIDLIMAYYDGLWGRTSTERVTSDWARYERGIFAGCTISVILFVAAFNVLLEYVSAGRIEGYTMSGGGDVLEVIRGFMDDVSLLTKSVAYGRVALQRMDFVVKWARMQLKPPKSRGLVVHKGRSMNVEPFSVDGVTIPSLQNKPLKTLGRMFDASITDRHCRKKLGEKIGEGLKKIDKLAVPSFIKCWSLHHIFLLQIRWDLMVYEIPLSWVGTMNTMLSRFLRKWLGLSKNLTDVALFAKSSPCPLPFTSLVQMFQVTKVNSQLQLSESKHQEVKQNARSTVTGKWKLYDVKEVFGLEADFGVIREAERRMDMERIVGHTQQGRAGIGYGGSRVDPKVSQRKALVGKVEQKLEEEMLVKAVCQSLQGQWTAWTDYVQRDIKWKSLFYGNFNLERFCIGATYNTLASPANLKRWGLSPDAKCHLCGGEPCTVFHILCDCGVARSQGRYRYRHDAVLRILAHHLTLFVKSIKTPKSLKSVVKFVKEGLSKETRRSSSVGILELATDWEVLVDLDRMLRFPSYIVLTLLRPDIVLVSRATKTVVLLELTCPSEERFDEAHRLKIRRYEDLSIDCELAGWKCWNFAVEVGARGYVAKSLQSCLARLGFKFRNAQSIVRECGDTSLRSSFWLWLSRDKGWT